MYRVVVYKDKSIIAQQQTDSKEKIETLFKLITDKLYLNDIRREPELEDYHFEWSGKKLITKKL